MTEGFSDRTPHRQRVADLYVACREGVYRSLLAAGLGPARAQETTQDAFLRLYVQLGDGAQIENPKAWVYRVAHNLGVDTLSREARESALPEGLADSMAGDHRSAEEDLIGKEWNDRVQRAIQKLSAQQRLCLELRAQGLRYQEIAEVMEIRPSTVGEFLRRAIRQLRKWNLCDQDR